MVTLKQYIDTIFDKFRSSGCRVDQGGFFTRAWYNDRTTTQAFKNHLFDVLRVMMQNGHIYTDDPNAPLPFIKLSQSGYDYMQGGDLKINHLSLEGLIDLRVPQDKIYNQLWEFIGKKDEAPFYLDSKTYYDNIAPFLHLSSFTYSAYTQKRVKDGKSTARTEWFRELFMSLPESDIPAFLDDLSYAIVETYQPQLLAEPEIIIEDTIINPLPSQEPNEPTVVTPAKKKIFISYTWETDTTPGHKDWVRWLADSLKSAGFEVYLDQYQRLGTNMNHFMMQSVKNADRILLICTPTFKHKSDNMINACGFEASMISNDLLKDINDIKFLPIVRIGSPADSLPIYLGNRNALIWHTDADNAANLSALITDLLLD